MKIKDLIYNLKKLHDNYGNCNVYFYDMDSEKTLFISGSYDYNTVKAITNSYDKNGDVVFDKKNKLIKENENIIVMW